MYHFGRVYIQRERYGEREHFIFSSNSDSKTFNTFKEVEFFSFLFFLFFFSFWGSDNKPQNRHNAQAWGRHVTIVSDGRVKNRNIDNDREAKLCRLTVQFKTTNNNNNDNSNNWRALSVSFFFFCQCSLRCTLGKDISSFTKSFVVRGRWWVFQLLMCSFIYISFFFFNSLVVHNGLDLCEYKRATLLQLLLCRSSSSMNEESHR